MTDVKESFRKRLEKYKKQCETLRQIHSDKAHHYDKRYLWHSWFTIMISTFITFLGFMGVNKIHALLSPLWSLDISWFNFAFNFLVFLILLLTIASLVFRFSERASAHNRGIIVLTAMLRDIDDTLGMPIEDNTDVRASLREFRERYKMITEILPPTSDEDFLQAKKNYENKRAMSATVYNQAETEQSNNE